MPDLDTVRRFAGADGLGDEDPVLEMCLQASISWFAGADVPAGIEDPDYDFWVANLAAWMYDNRGNAERAAAIPDYIVTSVHQLRRKAAKQLNRKLAALVTDELEEEAQDAIFDALRSLSNEEKAEALEKYGGEGG